MFCIRCAIYNGMCDRSMIVCSISRGKHACPGRANIAVAKTANTPTRKMLMFPSHTLIFREIHELVSSVIDFRLSLAYSTG